jgi:hypothetical protein
MYLPRITRETCTLSALSCQNVTSNTFVARYLLLLQQLGEVLCKNCNLISFPTTKNQLLETRAGKHAHARRQTQMCWQMHVRASALTFL